MKTFFSNLFDKFKGVLAVLGTAVTAFIAYKVISQEKEITTLKDENATEKTEVVLTKQEDQLNDTQIQETAAKVTLDQNDATLQSDESELNKLRSNRPPSV